LGRPTDHKCGGIEVKALVLVSTDEPKKREVFAEVCEASTLADMSSGLFRQAGIHQQDKIVGLGDGAKWIESQFDLLGIPMVLDVYHATEYVDRIMIGLGWSEEERSIERELWHAGKVDGGEWLKTFTKHHEKRVTWSAEMNKDVQYLEARVQYMKYPEYRAKGWPIGSGQIEGANKSVIGHRLKRSGQHWSRSGASGIASLRARSASTHPVVSFERLRRKAFPTPHLRV
jgi:hypothetical protein